MKCRHCGSLLSLPLIDLGTAPPSNAYLSQAMLAQPEQWFPLRVLVCESCWLAQTEDFVGREHLFDSDYAYFSSFSDTWLEHARNYVDRMVQRFDIGADSMHVEIASNDGYLLQFTRERGIPCLGIEPTASTAKASREKGIDTLEAFFGVELAERLRGDGLQTDLMTANNVLAHVPDIDDFVRGFAVLLKPHGVATFEFPHLIRLIEESQFDTIYHEHYSYLSLAAVEGILRHCGLEVFDVQQLPTHGGSLRVFAQLQGGPQTRSQAVAEVFAREAELGVRTRQYYASLQTRAERIKDDLLNFLIGAKRDGKSVAGYGAAAKGNTLLNFAGIKPDLLPWVVDRNPAKQEKYLPGSRIPIVAEERLRQERPDFVLILPWNLRDEVMRQLDYMRAWGGQFVTAVPRLQIR